MRGSLWNWLESRQHSSSMKPSSARSQGYACCSGNPRPTRGIPGGFAGAILGCTTTHCLKVFEKAALGLRVGDEWWGREMSCRRPQDVGARDHAKATCHHSNAAPPCCYHFGWIACSKPHPVYPCSSERLYTRMVGICRSIQRTRANLRDPDLQTEKIIRGAQCSEARAKYAALSGSAVEGQ